MKIPYRPKPTRTNPIPPSAFQDISQTRRPTFNQAGGFRGFRSTPGSTQSDRNAGTGIRPNGNTGFSNSSDWADFFKGNSPTGVRAGYDPTNQAIADAAGPMDTGGGLGGSSVPYTPPAVNYEVKGMPETWDDNGQYRPPTPGVLKGLPTSSPDTASLSPGTDASGYMNNVISSTQDWMQKNFGDMYG